MDDVFNTDMDADQQKLMSSIEAFVSKATKNLETRKVDCHILDMYNDMLSETFGYRSSTKLRMTEATDPTFEQKEQDNKIDDKNHLVKTEGEKTVDLYMKSAPPNEKDNIIKYKIKHEHKSFHTENDPQKIKNKNQHEENDAVDKKHEKVINERENIQNVDNNDNTGDVTMTYNVKREPGEGFATKKTSNDEIIVQLNKYKTRLQTDIKYLVAEKEVDRGETATYSDDTKDSTDQASSHSNESLEKRTNFQMDNVINKNDSLQKYTFQDSDTKLDDDIKTKQKENKSHLHENLHLKGDSHYSETNPDYTDRVSKEQYKPEESFQTEMTQRNTDNPFEVQKQEGGASDRVMAKHEQSAFHTENVTNVIEEYEGSQKKKKEKGQDIVVAMSSKFKHKHTNTTMKNIPLGICLRCGCVKTDIFNFNMSKVYCNHDKRISLNTSRMHHKKVFEKCPQSHSSDRQCYLTYLLTHCLSEDKFTHRPNINNTSREGSVEIYIPALSKIKSTELERDKGEGSGSEEYVKGKFYKMFKNFKKCPPRKYCDKKCYLMYNVRHCLLVDKFMHETEITAEVVYKAEEVHDKINLDERSNEVIKKVRGKENSDNETIQMYAAKMYDKKYNNFQNCSPGKSCNKKCYLIYSIRHCLPLEEFTKRPGTTVKIQYKNQNRTADLNIRAELKTEPSEGVPKNNSSESVKTYIDVQLYKRNKFIPKCPPRKSCNKKCYFTYSFRYCLLVDNFFNKNEAVRITSEDVHKTYKENSEANIGTNTKLYNAKGKETVNVLDSQPLKEHKIQEKLDEEKENNAKSIYSQVKINPQMQKEKPVNMEPFPFERIEKIVNKQTYEYGQKIQSLELMIVKLENQVLVEKLHKQNHSSTMTRLENMILKLENDLLHMYKNYEMLKQETEQFNKNHNKYLESAKKQEQKNRKYLELPDKTFESLELIPKHQLIIEELSDTIIEQTAALHDMKKKLDYLEEQNNIIHQMIKDQTAFMNKILRSVTDLSEQNSQRRREVNDLKQNIRDVYSKITIIKPTYVSGSTNTTTKFMENLPSLTSDGEISVDKMNLKMKNQRENDLTEYLNHNWCKSNIHNSNSCFYFSFMNISNCIPYTELFWEKCSNNLQLEHVNEWIKERVNIDLPPVSYGNENPISTNSGDENETAQMSREKNTLATKQENNIRTVADPELKYFKSGIPTVATGNEEPFKSQKNLKVMEKNKKCLHKHYPSCCNMNQAEVFESISKHISKPKMALSVEAKDGEKIKPPSMQIYDQINTAVPTQKTLQADSGKAILEKNKTNDKKHREDINVERNDKFIHNTERESRESELHEDQYKARQKDEKSESKQVDITQSSMSIITEKEKIDFVLTSTTNQSRQSSMNIKSIQISSDKVSEIGTPLQQNSTEGSSNASSKNTPKDMGQIIKDESIDKKQKKRVRRKMPIYITREKTGEAKDCYDHYRHGNLRDGLYKVKPTASKCFIKVFCDMQQGGWTIIQKRQDGTTDFFQDWKRYKEGFGGVYGEHWLGNDNIHLLTNQDYYQLAVELRDWNKNKKYAFYDYMLVDGEDDGYRLHIDGYSGDAGDGLSKHNGSKFSTKDVDNDKVEKEFGGSCANRFHGAGWYYKCYSSNLNGRYYRSGKIPEKLYDGITWKPWTGPNYSLMSVQMKIRPASVKH